MKLALTAALLALASLPAIAAPDHGFAFGQPAAADKALSLIHI